MKTIETRAHARPKRSLAALAAAALVGTALVAMPAASAHPGHDEHDGEAAAAADTDWANYEKILLTKDVGEPIDMAVLPDLRVLHTARNGEVRVTDPATGVTKVVNTLDVYANSEDGLQGIALAPDFEESNQVYLVYAPRDADGDGAADTPAGNAPNTLPAGEDESYWDQWVGVNRLARYTWTGDALDLDSEQPILDIEVQRGQCCHVGADIDFDGEGNLYLSTGDNTPAGTPGANGYAPNNDAPNMNPGFDSRRGAGSTNDLRGKILRIDVKDEIAAGTPPGEGSTYDVPAGNLFAPGTEDTRPEIFVMGVRNPFRIEVDPETSSLTWGDYGPDAGAANADRGPMGYVEWNAVGLDDPHNAGWPYCHGPNAAYNEWNFETATPREFFDCAAPVNNSRWNTGLTDLPPSRAATLYYGDQPGQQPRDELVNFGTGSGQAPMGGPVYHYDADSTAPGKLPEYWDGKAFFGEFSQDYLAAFSVDWSTFEVGEIEDFFPNSALTAAGMPINDNPIDLEFGPDGSLYVLEYGDGFFRQNPDSGLYRIDHAEGNKAPQAQFTATPESSTSAPVEVAFDATGSSDPDGDTLTYEWDIDGDGTFDLTGPQVTHTYTELGVYTARLRVTDGSGKRALTSTSISVGNEAPEVTVDFPADGGFFDWGDEVAFEVTTNDAEDGTETVCERVAWSYGLGHDEHAHPEVSGTGCTGVFPTDPNSPEHGAGAHLYGAVVITYTDNGANGLPPAAGEATLRLNPKLQQAEHGTLNGVEVVQDEAASAGAYVTGLAKKDSVALERVSLAGIDSATATVRGKGKLELRWGSPKAKPFATAKVNARTWGDVDLSFRDRSDTGTLYITATGGLDLDALTMVGEGVGTPPAAAQNSTGPTGAARTEGEQ
ncbi:PQQ-dependent sugar dehydrogenase [Promicromonospora sp. NPDC057488]|uniref:PQQ-dependent sugar dehydrogenase n=1 Tax=Promicromonospora sp. NPDC057488 TaxID=3346147 RepID=UPI00366BCD0F